MEYIEYPTGYDNASGRHWSKIKVEDVKDKDKVECYVCSGRGKEVNYNGETEECSTCDGRGWNYSGQEWEFSCDCGESTCWADCSENMELNHCECMED